MNFKNIFTVLALSACLAGCNDLDGDNSDFDFGDKTQAVSPEREDGSVRLATYNIHRCTPANSSVANYDNVAKAIKLVDADVIALQEIDCKTTRHAEDQMAELARRNGFNGYFCPAVNQAGGTYGIGIMSRETPLKTESVSLPGVEQRVMFAAEFDKYVFIATHLCVSSAANREWSYDIINSYVATNYAAAGKPVFLAGDLNDTGLPANALARWKVISAATPTFPSSSKRIDYVLEYTGNTGAAPCTVIKTMVPQYSELRLADVSDHLPVFVDLVSF